MASCCYHLKDVTQLPQTLLYGGVVFRKAVATRPCFDLTLALALFGGNNLGGNDPSLNLAILCPDLEQHCTEGHQSRQRYMSNLQALQR